MPKVNFNSNINTSEHYNKVWGARSFEIDYSQPMREGYLVGKFKGGRFLDLGCGISTPSHLATQKSKEVWAMDFSDKLIESLRYRFTNINYVTGDVRDIPFKNNFFDYIVMGEFLEHMEEPDKIIKIAVDLLKDGGIIAISVPYNAGDKFSIDEHIWSFSEKELEELLKPYGKVEVKPLSEQRHTYLFGFLTKNSK
jgi:2-polyprenyl-3-methyl-5-hydroxy-6-metoxy-1,4-benzoquinol methylase